MKVSLLILILNVICLVTWFVATIIMLSMKPSIDLLDLKTTALSNTINGDSPSLAQPLTIVNREDDDEENNDDDDYYYYDDDDYEENNDDEDGDVENEEEGKADYHDDTHLNKEEALSFMRHSSTNNISQGEWIEQVCIGISDPVCHHVIIVKSRKATFCSGAKVASTTTKQYFYDISDEGELVIPPNAEFGVHQANWRRFGHLEHEMREQIMEDTEWTHIFFWKHVLERFVSGYMDKVIRDCQKDPTDKPNLAIHYYIKYGFTCEEHRDLESFVNFLQTVPNLEGHFAPQTPLCNYQRFPYTDVIKADEYLNGSLRSISAKLGVKHPEENNKTTNHKTGAKGKLVSMFKDKPHLIAKILNLFQEDCDNIPESCEVKDIMAAIEKENMVR